MISFFRDIIPCHPLNIYIQIHSIFYYYKAAVQIMPGIPRAAILQKYVSF
jgi:hypothetical protein